MNVWKRLLAAGDKPAPSTDPWAAAARSAAPQNGVQDGFEAARRSRRSASAWLWAQRIAVGMLLVAGVIQLVIKPVRNVLADEPAPPTAVQRIDADAARAVAVGFTTDYLSWAGAPWAAHRAAALEQWLDPDGFAAAGDVGSWSGEAVLLADSATVQRIHRIDNDAAVVAVQARLQSFIPGPEPAPAGDVPSAPSSGAAAFTPTIPDGYVAAGAYWVRLAVPLTATDSGQVRVSAPGPVFTAEVLTPVAVTVESDSAAAQQVLPAAQKILTAYAAGDLQYVAAADSQLVGLSGELSVQDVHSLRVSSVTNADQSRNVAADVQWSLSGTGASITQTYGMTLRAIDTPAPQLMHLAVLRPPRADHSEQQN